MSSEVTALALMRQTYLVILLMLVVMFSVHYAKSLRASAEVHHSFRLSQRDDPEELEHLRASEAEFDRAEQEAEFEGSPERGGADALVGVSD